MYKQIFSKKDGTPLLIANEEFDKELFTVIQPEDGLYRPIHFDGKKWIGTSKETWLSNQPKEETIEVVPDEKDELIANLSVQLLETQTTLETVQNEVANLTIQLLERG